MDKIRLKNIVFYAHHGFFQAERDLGQKFEIDIEVEGDLRDSAARDDLSRTIDYRKIYEIARHRFEEEKFKLIETVASHIAEDVLALTGVVSVTIRVRKPHVPMRGLLDYVEVELHRPFAQ